MKVLTAAEMREVDRRTIELGIPGLVLMENAAHRVVEFLAGRFAPLHSQRVVVLCGKGNNGGDGLAIARQLYTRFHPSALHVALMGGAPEELRGDAAANYGMLRACGCPILGEIPPEARRATLLIDALLGTGIAGPAKGPMLEAIREINRGFPQARVVAVDLPSGMPSDSGEPVGECARADACVTFTALKVAHAMPPNCDQVGELRVGPIGSPPALYQDAPLSQVEPAMFRELLAPRPRWGHKGTFGHVLVVAGSPGKTGAAAMCGLAALRAGAGLVTVASRAPSLPLAPELMSASLEDAGVAQLTAGKTVIAMGPGLGRDATTDALVQEAAAFPGPVVFDADALIAPTAAPAALAAPDPERPRILTPHPGEMARLTGRPTAEIQKDRIAAARAFATAHRLTVVLKGQRTLLAFPDGRVWINPTGTPALGTGGSGDVLTGLIAGLLAQFPGQPEEAAAAAVYLHGLAGELGARELGEKPLIATDLLRYLSPALRAATEACAGLPDAI